ncbi:MAG: hypothetical protein JWQ96_3288 [Segetibacter sp.]|nr:hypothetical protein [Segetibacter sp.]
MLGLNLVTNQLHGGELALLEGQKPLPVGEEDSHSYGVDAGIGLCMDEEAMKAYNPAQLGEMQEGFYQDIARKWRNITMAIGSLRCTILKVIL